MEFEDRRLLLQGLIERIDVFDDRFTVRLRQELEERGQDLQSG